VPSPSSGGCSTSRRRRDGDRPAQPGFQEILGFIQQARFRALRAVNQELVDPYWRIGEQLSRRIQAEGWGQGTIEELAAWIGAQEPGIRGFSAQNLWRMRQFFETYRGDEFLSPLVRELPWSHNMSVINKCKSREERAFYLKRAVQERWGRRELERQMSAGLFEQALLGKPQLSSVMKHTYPQAERIFKDRHLVDFVDLPEPHSERDLQRALLRHLKDFLLELGRDFCFIGSEYPIQVGRRDFAIDLLFYHRGLQALVAIELKIGEFEPEHMGKLAFYLEALDRYHRKPHEAPSIGVLLCKSREAEVVEFALNRTLSPALVAEYQTKLPNKHMLQAKLEAFYAIVEDQRGQNRTGS
jgi:predicted nuclease of restriction endonuclease-like (RecB) superfamily